MYRNFFSKLKQCGLLSSRGNRVWLLLLILSVIACPGYAIDKDSVGDIADSLALLMNEDMVAGPVFDSGSTVDDYLMVAMKRNQGLHAAYNKWVADLKKSDYAGSLPDPVFNYAYFLENVETRLGPQEHRLGIRQSFPWFGTLGTKRDMAFAGAQVSYQKFQAKKYELFFKVKQAYYDYYYLGRDIELTGENLELLKFWESMARSKYKVGLKQHPDVIKAQVELGKLEDHLLTLRDQTRTKMAELRALLNLPDSVVLPIPQALAVVELPLEEDSVKAVIKENNPNIRASEWMVERSRAGEKLAGKESRPSFAIGVDYIMTGEAVNPSTPESGKDPLMIGGSISLPIWFGKNSAKRKEARALRRASEYTRQELENNLMSYTERVLFEYSDALRKTKLYRGGLVVKAEQSLNAIYAAYQAGTTDFLNVLDAQRQLLDFQLTAARERTRLAGKFARLEMLSGMDLNDYLRSNQ